MDLKVVRIENPDGLNLILGQSHFIKTVEDISEAMVNTVPMAKFGLAFCEASEKCLIRHFGTDEELLELAKKNAWALSAGHCFILFMKDMFPINVLNSIKMVPEVCTIYCATANPLQVVVVESEEGRAVAGVIDGQTPLGEESEEQQVERRQFLRTIGYKL